MAAIFVVGLIVVVLVLAGFFMWLYWIAASYVVDTVWHIQGIEGLAFKVIVFALIFGLITMINRIGRKSED